MTFASQWEGLSQSERVMKLVEANVQQGIKTLKENPDVIDAMRERGLVLHGLVYDVGSGELRELKLDESEDKQAKTIEAFETSHDGKRPQREMSVRGKEKGGEGHESSGHHGMKKHEVTSSQVGAVGGA